MSSGERYPYLDGVRGIAIACVLLAHFGPIRILDLGRFGVDLFFVLSGLLMSRILFEQRMPIGQFYCRRVSRIMPAFFAFLAIVGITFGVLWHEGSWREIAAYATFIRTYDLYPPITRSQIPVQNLWTLNVEEHCYLLLALIAAVAPLRRRATSVLFALAALTLVAYELHMHLRDAAPFEYDTECASTPLLLSAGYRTIALRRRMPGWLAPLALVLATGCYLSVSPWYLHIGLAPVLLTLFVNHIREGWSWTVRALGARWLCWLGILSYSLYLWQQPFHMRAAQFPFHSAVLFAVASGCVSFYLLEKPARRWLNAHWGNSDGPRAAHPARERSATGA